MKIRINKAACVGNARCWAVSEALFPLDDDGYIEVEGVDVPPGMEALARRGARALLGQEVGGAANWSSTPILG